MARPSKYTQELQDQLVGYIADGLTIRDACFGAGISEDTFWRWNREKFEFAEAIKQARANQKWSSKALTYTSEYRRYARKAQICPRKPLNYQNHTHTHFGKQKPSKQPLEASRDISANNASERIRIDAQNTLPVRSEPLMNIFGELLPTRPYINQNTGKVEWAEKELYGRCVLHRCSLSIWRKIATSIN